MITKEDAISINDENDLQYLIHRFKNGPAFAEAFVFENDDMYNNFFREVDLSIEEFQENIITIIKIKIYIFRRVNLVFCGLVRWVW